MVMMVRVRVRHYAHECPHNDTTMMCVWCVCVRRDRVQQLV